MKINRSFCTVLGLILLLFSCNKANTESKNYQTNPIDISKAKKEIGSMLDSFNTAAANAAFTHYFDYFTEDATFNGTDATENWDKKAFMIWAKPFFDKKNNLEF